MLDESIHSLKNYDLKDVSLQLYNKDYNKDRVQGDGEQQLPTTMQLSFTYLAKNLLEDTREFRMKN